MHPFLLSFFALLLSTAGGAQTVASRLSDAFGTFEKDAQLQQGIASLYVVDALTGKVIFEKNARTGLAPASTQKVITSVTAYELLGAPFRYRTEFSIVSEGGGDYLVIHPSGDPTLGSWRWKATGEEGMVNRLVASLKAAGVKSILGAKLEEKGWEDEPVPDGWIWQDIGNYYGAGARSLNWRENQFDIYLSSGNSIGDGVTIAGTKPQLYHYKLKSLVTSAAKGTGDNAYIYFPLQGGEGVIRGTIPAGESRFTISGSLPYPYRQFVSTVAHRLSGAGPLLNVSPEFAQKSPMTGLRKVHAEVSPPLDSIIYWFNRKSINLYGEALVKTVAFRKEGRGTTEKGIGLLQAFWKGKGIAPTELNMVDGSGLSPLNRVTTRAQVTILLHARNQAWFPGFYAALPEYNGMKMKSGTIRDVKGFTGYHRSADGKEYVFSFLVNNYNGSASTLVQKMYAVLNVLK